MSFDELFTASIRESLTGALGEDVFQAFLYYSKLNLSTASATEVHEKLLGIFREDGALRLEKIILKRLLSKLCRRFEDFGDFDFSEVKEAEAFYDSRWRNGGPVRKRTPR